MQPNAQQNFVEDFENKISCSTIIDKVLENYKPDFRFVKSFVANERHCKATVVVDKYPYAEESAFSYVTSTSLSLVLSQVSYLFIADLIIKNKNEVFNKIDFEGFLAMRNDGILLFRRDGFDYIKKIPKGSEFIFELELLSSRIIHDVVFGKFACKVDGHLSGNPILVAGPLSDYSLTK